MPMIMMNKTQYNDHHFHYAFETTRCKHILERYCFSVHCPVSPRMRLTIFWGYLQKEHPTCASYMHNGIDNHPPQIYIQKMVASGVHPTQLILVVTEEVSLFFFFCFLFFLPMTLTIFKCWTPEAPEENHPCESSESILMSVKKHQKRGITHIWLSVQII